MKELKKTILAIMLGLTIFVPVTSVSAAIKDAKAIKMERREYPNISKAIRALEISIRDMKAAPHNFGGHKDEAIEASQKAIEQLKKALLFRSKKENEK